MKKSLLILLAISLVSIASAQTAKCGIDTKALAAEEVAAGAQSLRFLAKMAPGFDRAAFEKAGIVFGAQAGDIYTLRVPAERLSMLDESKDVILYSISHHIAQPENDAARYDTRSDSVYMGYGVEGGTPFNGEGVYVGITDWGSPFDPLAQEDPERPTTAEEARIGGLGIFTTPTAPMLPASPPATASAASIAATPQKPESCSARSGWAKPNGWTASSGCATWHATVRAAWW